MDSEKENTDTAIEQVRLAHRLECICSKTLSSGHLETVPVSPRGCDTTCAWPASSLRTRIPLDTHRNGSALPNSCPTRCSCFGLTRASDGPRILRVLASFISMDADRPRILQPVLTLSSQHPTTAFLNTGLRLMRMMRPSAHNPFHELDLTAHQPALNGPHRSASCRSARRGIVNWFQAQPPLRPSEPGVRRTVAKPARAMKRIRQRSRVGRPR